MCRILSKIYAPPQHANPLSCQLTYAPSPSSQLSSTSALKELRTMNTAITALDIINGSLLLMA